MELSLVLSLIGLGFWGIFNQSRFSSLKDFILNYCTFLNYKLLLSSFIVLICYFQETVVQLIVNCIRKYMCSNNIPGFLLLLVLLSETGSHCRSISASSSCSSWFSLPSAGITGMCQHNQSHPLIALLVKYLCS